MTKPSQLRQQINDLFNDSELRDLPAGLEAVDTLLKTSQQVNAPQRYDWDNYFAQGWGWWYFDHV